MANIRVDLATTIIDGQSVTFRSPVDCSQITGLIVYYPEDGVQTSREFQFADAHGNNVGDADLFAENVLVKVILDTTLNRAYVQNADTNAYLEAQLASKAPAGYGLGNKDDVPVIRDWGTLNVVVQPGWYKVAFTTWFEGEHLLMVDAFDNMCFQTFMQRKDNGKANICRRSCETDGVWGDVEWIGDGAFAPSGYGLGEDYLPIVDKAGLDNWTNAGWCLYYDGVNPDSTLGVIGFVNSKGHNRSITSTLIQEAYQQDGYGVNNLTRVGGGGTWQPWEWVNPPMLQEHEYRTTERMWGNPVYKKLFYYGVLPNGQSDARHGIIGLSQVKKVTLIPHGVTTYQDHNPDVIRIDVDAEKVYITTNSSALAASNCFVLIEYNKN